MTTAFKAPNEWKSAIEGKCPRCRKGNMFNAPLLSFKSKKMVDHCPHCGLKFEKEPGYFYVAMYVSYVFVVAELITSCVLAYLITGNLESPWMYLIVAFSVVIILAPFNYRYSRIVLLYFLTPQFEFKEQYYLREPVKK